MQECSIVCEGSICKSFESYLSVVSLSTFFFFFLLLGNGWFPVWLLRSLIGISLACPRCRVGRITSILVTLFNDQLACLSSVGSVIAAIAVGSLVFENSV